MDDFFPLLSECQTTQEQLQKGHSPSISFWLIASWICTKERDWEAKSPGEWRSSVVECRPGLMFHFQPLDAFPAATETQSTR